MSMHGLLTAATLLIGTMNLPADPSATLPRTAREMTTREKATSPTPAAKRLQAEVWQALHISGERIASPARALGRFRR
jgi:hypothetical protein